MIRYMSDKVEDVDCTKCDEKVKLGSKNGSMFAYCGCDVVLKVADMDSPYVIEHWE